MSCGLVFKIFEKVFEIAQVEAELQLPWEHVPPVWELRIGQYRVFHDVNEKAKHVTVRAVRHKPAHKTTEEIL